MRRSKMEKGIICLGEALIDFIPLDKTNMTYQKCPGGAPANVSVGLAKLGAKSTFVGKVGRDVLGHFLKETLEEYKVDTSSMLLADDVRTGIVFVTLSEDGERDFTFYIDPSADRFLKEEEIDKALFQNNKIFHFGSISLISEPSESATLKAVQYAKEAGLLISYDPNLRLNLWESETVARKAIISMLPQADVLKISEEELHFITGQKKTEEGIKWLSQYDIPLIFVTMGSEGSYVFTKQFHVKIPAMKVQAVDTTGAGDAFVSGFLYCLNESTTELSILTKEEIEQMTRFASASGGLAASKKGAMTALPSLDEVHRCLRK
jgi:fructokinase